MPKQSPIDLFVPLLVILLTIIYLPITFLILLKDFNISQLTSWPTFQQAWFAHFWSFFGDVSKPLFATDVEPVISYAHGVVLDVGSGSGDWLYLFSPERNPRISKLLLLEPNWHFHESLRAKADAVGLGGKYEIVDGALEDLEGTVDTICTVHVLCSVSTPEPVVKKLYHCLKPGGQWLVYEHVKVRNGKSLAGVCQAIINTIWPIFLDGCTLTRDTEDLLRQHGKWELVELRSGSNQGPFNQMPHICGRLVKLESEGVAEEKLD